MARYQLHVQGGSDQFVIVPGGRLVAPQPVTRRTARPQANHHETAQTTEYLSTGEGHELNYLNIETRLAPEKANTIHLQLANRKGNGMALVDRRQCNALCDQEPGLITPGGARLTGKCSTASGLVLMASRKSALTTPSGLLIEGK
ncbi:hypothetical protein D3C80_1737890 [compost metagenome]